MRWQTVVQVGDLHEKRRRKQITTQQLGEFLAARLRKNKYAGYQEIAAVIENLLKVRTRDQYDRCLKELYDFGDISRRIWFAPDHVEILIPVSIGVSA